MWSRLARERQKPTRYEFSVSVWGVCCERCTLNRGPKAQKKCSIWRRTQRHQYHVPLLTDWWNLGWGDYRGCICTSTCMYHCCCWCYTAVLKHCTATLTITLECFYQVSFLLKGNYLKIIKYIWHPWLHPKSPVQWAKSLNNSSRKPKEILCYLQTTAQKMERAPRNKWDGKNLILFIKLLTLQQQMVCLRVFAVKEVRALDQRENISHI